jgi:hypothetical protein
LDVLVLTDVAHCLGAGVRLPDRLDLLSVGHSEAKQTSTGHGRGWATPRPADLRVTPTTTGMLRIAKARLYEPKRLINWKDDCLNDLRTKYKQQMATLLTLNFQTYEDEPVLAA